MGRKGSLSLLEAVTAGIQLRATLQRSGIKAIEHKNKESEGEENESFQSECKNSFNKESNVSHGRL